MLFRALRLLAFVAVALAPARAQFPLPLPLPIAATSAAGRCNFCARDARGRIRRSSAARSAFRRAHPCPSTGAIAGACPGWQIDHVVPLHRGGRDVVENMQWLSLQEHREKTARER